MTSIGSILTLWCYLCIRRGNRNALIVLRHILHQAYICEWHQDNGNQGGSSPPKLKFINRIWIDFAFEHVTRKNWLISWFLYTVYYLFRHCRVHRIQASYQDIDAIHHRRILCFLLDPNMFYSCRLIGGRDGRKNPPFHRSRIFCKKLNSYVIAYESLLIW